ncbi:Rieske (2Fe-2S) protein [Rhizorhabdus wittichii DC-6]|jgi:phenylpropionate dioxygenase-like ring-hydroxylating dioxygenase large terminal subunit|uniref:Rieske (2Fe-2S) domain protein n=2 Tax=Rhizorhabdus wittichii TaxID=160791 RepID=A0A9J9H9Q8_RHIWR|nr:SRPBCC family protein [Rhizorhabdus wittichii]ABQ67329.1 Rieske (2Fe-2S) domain protein [Rhizorhabdus wittichii RW1]ARR55878.1 Rieske (2Fe-2S) protein [Rhizorhabdus wittichii DC-6]QTH23326.1 Rieske 2Fe-2S domain-containing protein [Rhizorhabdus wittichii]
MNAEDPTLSHIGRSIAEIRAELGVDPVSVEAIRDPAVYELEREKIFRRAWLKVATAWEIPEIGDYKVKEMPVADTSVLIVRGKDDKIRAFHNVCTHRGNKVVPNGDFESFGRSRAGVVTCRFHGWVFGTDGPLRSVPMEEGFGKIDKSCLGLREIACDTWEGFVFINFADPPEQSLLDYLGDFAKLFGGYPYAESTTIFRYSTVLECNWKVAHQAFSEGYHVPTIHAGSLPGFRGVEHSDFKLMGPHASSTIYGAGMDTAASTAAFAGVLHGAEPHRPRPDQLPPGINPTRRTDFQFELPNLFPNLIIHLSAGCGYPGMSFFTHQFWPLDHGRTLWEGINYFRPARNAAERVAQLHVNALHRNAWLEDTATMEDTFTGIRSGAIDQMYLMDQEFLIRHAVRVHDDFLAA